MKKLFDPTAPVKTRGGLSAKIIYTNKKGTHPIVAIVTDSKGKEQITTYQINGSCGKSVFESEYDLVNIPKLTSGWVNIFRTKDDELICSRIYENKDEAIEYIELECQDMEYVSTTSISW